ncbi:nuclear transport factor 2 family protein [uncultured Mucilaginibacter sp.]|uniref:nuclear transport factor 2 family protein n=1 Tax=uncultured Mucilaginibacter sp. TaxID=797541 RepID=UPI0026242509|nr:nuclear transport factor 2 family protein [uncultured Mucilaginibacter sp.]
MQKTVGLILLFLSVFSISVKAQSKEEKQVAAAVETLKKAMIDGNKTALENISSDQLSYGHSSGKVQDKAAFVETIVSGQSDFVTIDLTGQTIVIKDKTAIVRHTLSAQTNDGGKPGNVNLGVMLVWVKEKGNWKLLGRQAFKL